MDKGLNKRGRLLLIIIPTLIFSFYLSSKGDIIGILIVSATGGAVATLILHYDRRRKVPRRIDERLVLLLLHMYVVSQGDAGPDDLVRVIAETEDYGYYGRIFSRIRYLAKRFGYGFTRAVSQVANNVKPPLRDILIRCVEVFSTLNPRGYLELEFSTIIEEYSGYYLRAIESIKVLSGIFSTFQGVLVFIIMTLSILTIFTANPDIIYYSYAISIPSTLAIFLGFKSIIPKDYLVHLDKEDPPRTYRAFKLSLPISLASIAPSMVIALLKGIPYSFMMVGASLILPGILAYKFERFILKVDEQYPAFVKCLGENMASTSSLKAALSYVLYMELGPLKNLLKRALARVNIGISNEKALSLLSAEASSHRIYMTNKMFIDAVNYGGDPLEVGKILGNSCVKFLEFRKRRESVAKSFEAIILILQPIIVSLLIILTHLCKFFSQSLISLPFFNFGRVPIPIVEMGNIILISFMVVINSLMIREVRGGFWGTAFLYAGILFLLSGASWIIAEMLMDLAFGQVLKEFEGVI